MKNRTFLAKPALVGCFILVLSSALRAQPFPPVPWPIPADTTHYIVTNWTGRPDTVRRPPDSTMIPASLVIRFRPGMLDSGILSGTYWSYFDGHNAKHKGNAHTLGGPDGGGSGPYDEPGEPRGFWPNLRSELFSEQFGLDSVNNVVKDTLLRNFMLANGCNYLHRLTAASPLDTLTITVEGDTVPCDLPNWMVISFDSDINPLYLGYLLVWMFPKDIAMAYPNYYGGRLNGQPSDLYYTLGYEQNISMIEADTAWNFETGDTNIIVEVADAGLNNRHPDFGDTEVGPGHKWEAIWNYDYNNTGVDSIPDHGTAMSGIIGALSNNVIGDYSPFDTSVAGIAGGHGTLRPNKISEGRGVTLAGYVANPSYGTGPAWEASIFEASSKSPNTPFGLGVQVINCSEGWELGQGDETYYEPLHAALNYAFLNGVTFVAAISEGDSGLDAGQNPTVREYPANFDDPWVIAVGGSWQQTYKEKQPGSDFGYTMDIIAPDGAGDPITEPNSYILNYTTRQLTSTSPFTYGPYGGTSPAAANVSGSAALLLSHFFRPDSSLAGIEPEDIQNILKASAWRGDTTRLAHPELSHSWVPINGYGHLDIGHAFEMLDSNLSDYPDAGYKLYHGTIIGTPPLDTGSWTVFTDSFQFIPAWQEDDEGDTFSVPLTPMLPEEPAGYKARWRTLTYTYVIPENLENSDTCPLFAWGRSGGAGNPTGWSFANMPNYETGWTKITNGLGADPDSLMDGIFAPGDTLKLETVQYDVYGWVDSTGSYSHYYGHCPKDPQVGVNFSYFGRAKQAASGVKEAPAIGGDSLTVSVNNGMADVQYFTGTPLIDPKIEFWDILGRQIVVREPSFASAGWNDIKVPSQSLASGSYYCIVSAEGYLQTKSFLIIK